MPFENTWKQTILHFLWILNCKFITLYWTFNSKTSVLIGSRTIAPPGELPHQQFLPGWFPPRYLPPRQLPPRKIAHPDNCSHPENYPKDNFPLKIFPPLETSSEENCLSDDSHLHNCPLDKWSWGKLSPPPRKIVPRINYTRDIFPQGSEILILLIDSCFLLLSFFVV